MIDTNAFRQTLGNFATGVTVVTMNDGGDDHAMTVNSFSSVSLDPPLVAYNADKGTDSHDFTARAENYAVNVLGTDQEWLSNRFAGEHKEMDDPFEDVDTTRGETGALVFEDAIAYLDCSLAASHDAGDHTIYVGEVQEFGVNRPSADPLTFFRGEYGRIE
ncbi:flavin reductase family protein [Natrarchaeobius chitinivorans]|uniref:Flavin reductase n=1 Tax=Natrarchaeobius chitinivorans TaxID=1679083 RepID=A0A3N6P973_NATCH|nr:flavin reductase family protein [Natrarchaeobius chitinivorans]RQG95399.1 flavin reductase [Natrarchaeobius chitinivorans]